MAKKPPFNFSKAYAELEEVVQYFESEAFDLNQALPKFERGLQLAKELQDALKEVELKVEQVKGKYGSGELKMKK